MNRKEIYFIIDREGNIQSTFKGIKGTSCSLLAEQMKTMGHIINETKTDEYFQKASENLLITDNAGKTK